MARKRPAAGPCCVAGRGFFLYTTAHYDRADIYRGTERLGWAGA